MSFSTKALQVLKTVAPTLAMAIGGPFGPLAATAISAALGAPEGDTKAAETALLSATPDALLALRKSEQDFTVRMRELGISEEQLVFADISNARSREVALRDHTPAVLAYGITVGFFGTLGFLLVYGKPSVGGDALLVMLGALGGAWASIVAYYFGSSSSSARKDATISAIAKS